MIGFIFAIIASFSKGLEKILHRYVLVSEDSLSYAFVWHLIVAIIFFPLFILNFQSPQTNIAWIYAVISASLWALVGYTGYKSYSLLDVSVKAPIDKSRLFFVLVISIIFLKETLTIGKFFGTILIFLAIWLVSYKSKKKDSKISTKGIVLSIISAIIMASALTFDKFAVQFFSPEMYPFMVYFLPAMILLPFCFNKTKEIKSIFKNNFKATLGTAFLGAIYYYLLLKAYTYLDVSIVIPITELSALIAVLGGIIFLKERKDIIRKLLAISIALVGGLLISGVLG